VIHLDTSFLVDLLREQARGKDGAATTWLEGASASPLAVSIFAHCELEAGAANAAHPVREREKIRALLASVSVAVPGQTFAARYGATLVHIHRASKSISTMDLLIATMALDAGASLLTGNPRHFEVVPDLTVFSYR
jgi:tRNA(fMet)-specific endonuclease VapC